MAVEECSQACSVLSLGPDGGDEDEEVMVTDRVVAELAESSIVGCSDWLVSDVSPLSDLVG